MAKETIYRCDKLGCNLTRPEIDPTSKWFRIGLPAELTDTVLGVGLVIMPFAAIDEESEDKIFCGIQHAIEYLSDQLNLFHPVPQGRNQVEVEKSQAQNDSLYKDADEREAASDRWPG